VESLPDHLASLCDAYFREQLGSVHFEPFAFTDTFVRLMAEATMINGTNLHGDGLNVREMGMSVKP
jgi:hypothetical protein